MYYVDNVCGNIESGIMLKFISNKENIDSYKYIFNEALSSVLATERLFKFDNSQKIEKNIDANSTIFDITGNIIMKNRHVM